VSILPSEINKEVAKELGIPLFMQFVFSLKKSKIEELKKQKNAYYRYFFVNVRKKEDLDEVKEFAENGRIKPVIEKIYAFNDSKEAFKDLAKGHAKGKLVIKIK
jgi:NADPH:quinone reductase-like Zn-dependent oxidoreductase